MEGHLGQLSLNVLPRPARVWMDGLVGGGGGDNKHTINEIIRRKSNHDRNKEIVVPGVICVHVLYTRWTF